MKKFLTVLALLAVALNFSSAQLWAEDSNSAVATETTTVIDKDNGISVENSAPVAQEEKSEEKKADDVVASDVTTAVAPVTGEEKKEEEKAVVDANSVTTEQTPAPAVVS